MTDADPKPKKPTAAERKAAEKATIAKAAENLVACARSRGLDECGIMGAIVSLTRTDLQPADLTEPEACHTIAQIADLEASSDALRDEWQRIEDTPTGKLWGRVYRAALADPYWGEPQKPKDDLGGRKL